MPRVHPFVQQIDGFALAGAIDAADQGDDREAPVQEQIVLRIEQCFAQPGHLARISLLGDCVAQLRRFEHFRSLSNRNFYHEGTRRKSIVFLRGENRISVKQDRARQLRAAPPAAGRPAPGARTTTTRLS